MLSANDNQHSLQEPLISIVIPCYNQGHFLAQAVESILSQSHKRVEIIVVDDGSTDNTRAVAQRYPSVRYIYQHNQRIAVARNTGLQHSTGDYIVFLDSDDYLCEGALAVNLAYLQAHPEYAFVAGNFQWVNTDGSQVIQSQPHGITRDFYLGLLERNYIGMPGIVMYRRAIVEAVGGFNTSPQCYGCEDYDIYMRIATQYPIFCHSQVVASYRRHGNGVSNKPGLMLQSALYVLHSQWPYVQTKGPIYRAAYRRGENSWRNLYGRDLFVLILQNMRAGRWKDSYRHFLVLRPHIFPAIEWQLRRVLARRPVHAKAT
jgi:glycosyltransferase involved in cell wall biosynthesis